MSTSNFRNAAKKFIKAGIHPKWLIPIAPIGARISRSSGMTEAVLGKAPGRFNERDGSWSGLYGDIITEGATRAEHERFLDWPTENVGILGRAYPAIDSDALTEAARVLVETAVIETFGRDAVYAERIRGNVPRRLYVFKCADPKNLDYIVRSRQIVYTLGRENGEQHKLDIKGHGGQCVITGTHPSGDLYEWEDGAELYNPEIAKNLTEIDNADMERFIEVFIRIVERKGGEVLHARAGGATGERVDVSQLEPAMPAKAVLAGLRELPNTPETFPERNDLVGVLSAVRAALGKELTPEVEDKIFAWATENPEWCDEDYFDKIWNSLDAGVAVSQGALDVLFRRNDVRAHTKYAFDDNAEELSREIRKEKKVKKDKRLDVLATVASRYIFGHVNAMEGQSQNTMRSRWDVDRDWDALKWWKMELAESDVALIAQIQEFERYPATKLGYANFMRDMMQEHPDCFFSDQIRHPAYEKGEIFEEKQPNGIYKRFVNVRFISQAIREARRPDPNPERSQKDVAFLLKFIHAMFGSMADYELDTLAYMAQTGDRPGHMLFLVGDSGVGKTVYVSFLATLFDGNGPDQSSVIDGSKLMNESSRRFALGRAEGCRIISIQELPKGVGKARDMAAVTSQLKQIVDAGSGGDWIQVERKGENIHPVRNFARVLISSNYENSIEVDEQERRIFYVKSGITIENKPPESVYQRMVDIINDPVRLAAFWRYLLTRDIGNYSRHTKPPTSTAKAERIIMGLDGPVRHLYAALALLKASSRTAFDTEDLAEIMTKMADYEYINSGGTIDDRTDYTRTNNRNGASVEYMSALRAIRTTQAVKLPRNLKSGSKRIPTIYVLAGEGDTLEHLMMLDRRDMIDFMEAQRERPLPEHPFEIFRKPE